MVKKGYIIIVFLALLFILPLISADSNIVKAGTCYNIIILSNESQVNLSTVSIGSYLDVVNGPMSNPAGISFNYSYCNTSTIGTYTYSWYPCQDLTCFGTFTVTRSGVILNSAESLLYLVLIFINLLVFGFFLYWTIKLPYGNKTEVDGTITKITKTKYIKLLSSLFAYGSFLWFFAIFTGIVNNFISLDVFRGLISSLYVVLMGIGLGFTFLIFIILFVELWKDILLWDEIKKFGKAHAKE